MKKLNLIELENVNGGGMGSTFCSGFGGARAGIALYNAAAAAGVIATGTIATGGGLILAITAGCAVYTAGNVFGWWN